MEFVFSGKFLYSKDVITRSDVLSISKQLCNIAADKYGLSQNDLGRGIRIFYGHQSIRFNGPEDLAENFPPLETISGFYVSAVCNPFLTNSKPSVSLVVSKEPRNDFANILVTAASKIDAQELALKIAETLPGADGVSPAAGAKEPLQQNREKKGNGVKQCAPSAPGKPPLRDPLDIKKLVKGLISLAALVGAVVGIFADWDQAAEKIRELLSAFHP